MGAQNGEEKFGGVSKGLKLGFVLGIEDNLPTNGTLSFVGYLWNGMCCCDVAVLLGQGKLFTNHTVQHNVEDKKHIF